MSPFSIVAGMSLLFTQQGAAPAPANPTAAKPDDKPAFMISARVLQLPGELPPFDLGEVGGDHKGLVIKSAGNRRRLLKNEPFAKASLLVHTPVLQANTEVVEGVEVTTQDLATVDVEGDCLVYFATPQSTIEFASGVTLDLAHHDDAAGYRWLAAPRILVSGSKEASISVASPVPYLEPDADGKLVQTTSPDLSEGVSITLMVDAHPDEADAVSVTSLKVEVSEVAGRWTIPNVAFNTGKPIMRTRAVEASFILEGDSIAVVPLTPTGVAQGEIFLLLTVEKVKLPL